MSSSTRIKIVLTILISVAISGGIFFFEHTAAESAWAKFQNRQPFYAEVPTRSIQIPPTASAIPSIAPATAYMKVPILVFHIVRPSYPTDSQAVKSLAQTPEIFDAEMKHLADAGYHVISFGALEEHLRGGTTSLPANPVVISFDDGWSDQFKYAFPILQKYHYTATFFVFTNPIGHRGFMTWDELRALRDAGMTIGSHSLSHPFLLKITDPNILWNEIYGSKMVLEKNLNITVHEFAYPFGRYGTTTLEAVEKAGYTSARGDYIMRNGAQSASQIFELSALNAPTTLKRFIQRFPVHEGAVK